MASIWKNGWEYNDSNNKPYIRDFNKSSQEYEGGGLTWWTWQKGGLWIAADVTTRFKNTTQSDLKLDHLEIRTCACDSGGQSYWAWGGMTSACYGHGGLYYAYVRVSNDGGKTWEKSDTVYNIIQPIDGTNMNSKGTSGTHTASFGNPPYTGNKGFTHHDYPISNCPTILPGGIAAIHLGIHEFYKQSTWPTNYVDSSTGFASVTEAHNYIKKYGSVDTVTSYSQCCIKFNLDPGDMVVQITQEDRPYVWKMVDGKWECIKPAYIKKDGTWQALEDVFKL